jgi:enediyne biosynthesis protein E4
LGGPVSAAENQIRLNGSGVAAGDVDGDGRVDLYFCSIDASNHLFRNLGDWRFEDITVRAGVGCDGAHSTGAVFADVDGDGDLDLLVASLGGGVRLFLNDGHGHFAEKSDSGLLRKYAAMSMALGDLDGDGLPDLYVANYRSTTIRSTGLALLRVGGKRAIRPEDRDDFELTQEGKILEKGEPDFLYRNLGEGRFEALSWTNGVFLDEKGAALTQVPRDWGQAVMIRDFDGDGLPDIYVCNDFHTADRLWINLGGMRFREVSNEALRCTSTFSMSIDAADVNRDGADDFFVADMLDHRHGLRMIHSAGIMAEAGDYESWRNRPQLNRNTLQLGRGDGTFAEAAHVFGVEASGWTWSAIFLDVDLDGYEDLLMAGGAMFDTQDLDANERIAAEGPYPPAKIPGKLLKYPSLPAAKQLYRNVGGRGFEEVGGGWGFGDVGVAQGMCLADLDNDGDMDVVVNELNGPAGLYRNEGGGARVGVRLKGKTPNTAGIGAKIRLYGGAVAEQSQEMICGGRYLSGDQAMRVFAAGKSAGGMRLEVDWRGGGRTVIEGVEAGWVYEVEEQGAGPRPERKAAPAALFEDATARLGLKHQGGAMEDMERQPLLPRSLSGLGPGVAWVDVDGDGLEDVVAGGGRVGELAYYRNDGKGGFGRVVLGATGREVWGLAASGGVVVAGLSDYVGGEGGKGGVGFYGNKGVEPEIGIPDGSVGAVAMTDKDGSGNLALFAGVRVRAGRYPQSAGSRVYRRSVAGWEMDEESTRAVSGAGMVSGAVWTDLDGDGYPELVLACEWGPVRVYRNTKGVLKEATEGLGLAGMSGWWNGVGAGDFDGDGKMDLVVSNWGLNSGHRPGKAVKLYYGDLGGQGRMDTVMAEYDEEMGKWAPVRDMNAMGMVMPGLRERYRMHRDYAAASVEEVLGEKLGGMQELEAKEMETVVLLNRGDHFERAKLPVEAQWSAGYGVCVGDFDGDGREDVVMGQNFFGVPASESRQDAGRGLMMKGDGRGGFEAVDGVRSGLKVYGEQRGVAAGDYDGDGRVDLLMGQTGAEVKLYHNMGAKAGLRVKLAGPAGNPGGLGAVMRVEYKGGRRGPAREVHGGGGYWSQDGEVAVLGLDGEPEAVEVRWPGGRMSRKPVETPSQLVVVQAP